MLPMFNAVCAAVLAGNFVATPPVATACASNTPPTIVKAGNRFSNRSAAGAQLNFIIANGAMFGLTPGGN